MRRRLRALAVLAPLLLAACAGPGSPAAPSEAVRLGSDHWKSGEAILSLAATPDGALLAAGDASGTVRILDAADGSALRAFEDHDRAVRALAFSPDGSLLASVGEDRRAVLRRTADGSRVGEFRIDDDGRYAFASAAFSPDGATLAAGSLDAGVILLDAATARETARWDLQTWGVSSIAWSADGGSVLCGGGDGAVRVVEPSTGRVLRVLREPKPAWSAHFVLAAPAGSDGSVAAVRVDGIVDLWAGDGSGGAVLEEAGASFPCAVPASDGTILLAARDGTLRRVDPRDGRETARFPVSPRALVAICPVGATGRVAAAGEEGAIRILDAATGAFLAGPEGHLGPIYCIAPSPDGRRVATGGRDGSVRLWDAATGADRGVLYRADGPVYAVAFSADGTEVAAGGWDGALRRFRADDGAPVGTPITAEDPVIAIRAGPEGGFETERGYPPRLPVADPSTRAAVLATAVSPDGRVEWRARSDGTAVGRPLDPPPVR